MRIQTALLLVSVLFASCNSDSPTSPGDKALGFETVVKAAVSGYQAPARLTVRSAGEWAQVWQTLHARQSPVPPLPAIDFDSSMVVVAATGDRINGCFTIDVTGVTQKSAGGVELELTETVPGPACVCLQFISQPVHVVKVSRLPGPATFVERQTERRC